MKDASNNNGGRQPAYPHFSLIRRYDALFKMLDAQAAVVLHAPPGCGKRRAVLQWLRSRGHDYLLSTWQKAGEKPVLKGLDTHCLIIDLGRQQQTEAAWRALADAWQRRPQCAGPAQKLIVLTTLFQDSAAERLGPAFHYHYGFNDLAFSVEEISDLFELLPEACRLGNTSEQLYTLSAGWPALVTDLLASPVEPASTAPHSEERLRKFVARWLDLAGQRLSEDRKTVLWLLSALGALPLELFTKEGLGLVHVLAELQTAGLVSRVDSDFLVLNPESPAVLILDAEAFSPASDIVHLCAEWLLDNDCQSIAIEAYLHLKDWTTLESLLLANADGLTARLHVYDLRRWISQLDEAQEIRHPIILICAIRCAIYQGSDLEIKRYFQRVVDLLRHERPEVLMASMSEERWSRFIAEIQLYSELTQQGVMLCREWASQAGQAIQTSPVALLQEAFGLAQAGEMAKLMPIVVSGLDQSAGLKSWALHLTFSIFNFWMLMLSCRCRQAEAFLEELRARLIANKVTLASAYDWLDMLTLLLERMKGHMPSVQARIEDLQKQPRVRQDVLKNNLLVTIRADLLMMQGDSYLAQQGLHELATVQSSATPRSYWFASAATMHEALALLQGSTDAAQITLPPANQLNLAHLGLQAQTALLWRIKSHLHQCKQATVFPYLDQFQSHLMRTGQWLRSLEVDVLRAVCLHRSHRDTESQTLFARVARHLEAESLLGVLADPFLLWRPLLRDSLPLTLRSKLNRLLAWRNGGEEAESFARDSGDLAEGLTSREKQVLCLLAEGLKNQSIADRLNLSITTVRTHVQNIYRKLEVNNRATATAYACRMNMV
ncbi:response regulator transcription factor [Allohahella marinimesophila]|uniref:HTH luxR-type domain-containing protein n=1 Tax=Allohahella marinimesophila TaxID=1054972 RepID=A0ABP7NZT8_9GAMM